MYCSVFPQPATFLHVPLLNVLMLLHLHGPAGSTTFCQGPQLLWMQVTACAHAWRKSDTAIFTFLQ